MKITKAYIANFKLLKDFELNFSDGKNTAMFIGINGSGKSSILEFFSLAFSTAYQHLKLRKKNEIPQSLWGSSIEYIIRREKERDRTVTTSHFNIDYLPVTLSFSKNGKIDISLNYVADESFFYRDLMSRIKPLDLLPDRVVTYYSGIAQHQKHTHKKIADYIARKFKKDPLKTEKGYVFTDFSIPMYLFDRSDYAILFAGLWAFQFNERISNMLYNKLNLTIPNNHLLEISIVRKEIDKQQIEEQIRERTEGRDEQEAQRIRENYLQEIEQRRIDDFFGVQGTIRGFLLQLSEISSGNQGTISNLYNAEHAEYNFKIYLEQWQYLAESVIQNPTRVFELLLILKANNLLKGIKVNVKKNNEEIESDFLSEGEKQAIIIMAMNEILGTANTLYLFDEPDNFLHPSLQDDLIKNIEEGHQGNIHQNHYLITTHNPASISNLNDDKAELFIMDVGKLYQHHMKWYGRDVNDITAQIMGSEPRPEWAENEIQKVEELIDQNIKKGEEAFEDLKSKLSSKDKDVSRLQTKIDFLKD